MLGIDEREGAVGIILSVGAQIPNILASSLCHSGATVIGVIIYTKLSIFLGLVTKASVDKLTQRRYNLMLQRSMAQF